jgi:hypothetical protein
MRAETVLYLLVLLLRGLGFWGLCWHPRYGSDSLALPLCGAAPTFLCSGKEK